MPVELSDRTDGGDRTRLVAAAERLLVLLERAGDELGLVLVDDEAIRELNRSWRGKDRSTDVLSFPQGDADELETAGGGQAALLGDVVISVDTAARQAAAGGWTDEEELNRLLLHGLLHLLGHDHEGGGEVEARMQAEERRLAAALIESGFACAHEDLG